MISRRGKWTLVVLVAGLGAGCSDRQVEQAEVTSETPDSGVTQTSEIRVNPENWPLQQPVMVRDPVMEQRIVELMGRMTLEEKVGQTMQADINSITVAEAAEYNLGSVLNGGGSAPGGDNRTSADAWLALADEFWEATTDTSDGGVGIPLIWGTDAVHGHSNVVGATIFPHNIGLGAANDPDLMYQIGRATALEMLATGLDWTFAPTIAVVRNDRWGRTYESYSEDPAIVAAFAPRIIEGIQGVHGTDDFLAEGHMLATAKHFAGDGGTVDGVDQGNTTISEAEFRDVQSAAYPPAVAAGIQSVMASFNSFHGRKMHGYKEMLSDVLVDRMGFDGFVVGDWNGHGQVEGCTNTSCAASFNAGLDMFMAPDSWKGLYEATLQQVRDGEITMERLDEAVARILRVKFRAGIFDAGKPSARSSAGDFSLLSSPEHRAIAREAVRKSLVLLKNNNGVLPLKSGSTILVAGDGADDIGKQSGGWTLSWQGTGNSNSDFPFGTSIYAGIRDAAEAGGGSAILSEDGSYTESPDVAVVVFGEDPYAEFQGDRPHVDYDSDDGLELLKKFRSAGIPTVAVFISGRAMWVNPELNAADAFVATWLPGTEGGGGIADVIVGDEEGNARFDFAGRLSFSWPRTADQVEVNLGDEDYNPLFAYGHGLDYSSSENLPVLSEDSGLTNLNSGDQGSFIEFGDPTAAWRMTLRDEAGNTRISDSRGLSPTGNLQIIAADRDVQEDTILLTWAGPATLAIEGEPANFLRESNGDMALELVYQVIKGDTSRVEVSMGRGVDWQGTLDLTEQVNSASGKGWQTGLLKLSCFAERGATMESITEPLLISADAGLVLQINSARIVANPGNAGCGE